jgi:phosphate transport system substrate-binding protein
MFKKPVVALVMAALLAASVSVAQGLTGRISVGGSTTVHVVAVPLAERFMEKHPGVVVETHSVGSTAGVVGAREGTFDIGMSSRLLRGEEPGWGLKEFSIWRDGLVPIVHPDNPVRNLTMEQLAGIFTGQITNWQEVGGRNQRITVIIREEGSGARASWEDHVHEDVDPAPTVILVGTGGVRAGVAGDPAAISYVSIPAVDPTVRALTVDGVEATLAIVEAGEWPISQTYLFLTRGDPSPLAQEFINFVLGEEGQAILRDLH